jgi:hypothetical protein
MVVGATLHSVHEMLSKIIATQKIRPNHITSLWYYVITVIWTNSLKRLYTGITIYRMSILWKIAVFSYKLKLLWNYEKCFNTETWHTCWLDHILCNSMLNLKFPVSMTKGGGVSKLRKILYCFSIKTDLKVLQLLNRLR